MNRNGGRWWFLLGGLLVLGLVAVIAALREVATRITNEEIQERIVATIQSEAKQSLLVTGSVDLTATVTVENVRTLLPGLLDIDVGTSRVTVQVPGRAFYGFDVRELTSDKISISGDTVRIAVPPPRLISVDANLQELRVWSSKGWLRSPRSVQSAERSAIQRLDNALARQASSYVTNSAQPRVNGAEALRKMVEPILSAAGITRPVFQFDVMENLRME